jgi:hypothetical protein
VEGAIWGEKGKCFLGFLSGFFVCWFAGGIFFGRFDGVHEKEKKAAVAGIGWGIFAGREV